MHRSFGTGIEQEHIALVQRMNETMVVEHLSLHRCDGRERQREALTTAGLLDDGRHLSFMDARSDGAISCQMHACRHVDSLIDDAYLFLVFIDALGNDGLHHALRHLHGLLFGVQAEQFPQPDLMIATIGR